ncbi:hypothetical protein G7046_g1012 [Stylonectria norvegica]|nr:hypothetical protein G7046_g1012 [Stylonectria norvegica]
MGSISIRKYIQWHPDEASEPTSTIVVTSPERRFVDLRILRPAGESDDQLEWAIAGTSSSWKRDDGKGGQITHSEWRHWIDSRTNHPENATDEGDMIPQPDGTTLEKGSMINPSTGKETAYDELWWDVEPSGKAVVLQVESEGLRGSVVWLGQYCQGLMKDGDAITAERWELKDGEWKRLVRVGEGVLPCLLAVEFEGRVGDVVDVGGREWRAVEVS